MGMKYYFKTLAPLFILCICSCNKSKTDAVAGGTLLSQEISTTHYTDPGFQNTVSTRSFSYNQDKQVESIIDVTGNFSETFLFQHNSLKQMTKMSLSNSTAGAMFEWDFIYDTQGRIVKKTGIPLLANLILNDVSYTYDVNNNVIADSIHSEQSPEVLAYNVYEYTGAGNISRQHTFDLTIASSDTVYNYTYGDKLNPYYQIRSAEYFGEDQLVALSKSNLIDRDTNPAHFIANAFSYYSNGLPRSISYKQSTGNDYYTVDFIYK
jgi:hypothetical protein